MRQHCTGRRFASVSLWIVVGAMTAGSVALYAAQDPPWSNGVAWPRPKVVDPGPPGGPPSDAIVLFDGKDLAKWDGAQKWKIKDGYAICGGELYTKQAFGDCQLHVEWCVPADDKGRGQNAGNSGIFMMGYYEIQVLESHDNDTYYDGQAAAIYKQHPPLVNACRKRGEWQTYDIIWRAPRFDAAGKLLKPAYVTLLQNGVLVQDHFELLGRSNYRKPPYYEAHPAKLPLRIQFHGHPVHYRNIWIREIGDSREDLLAPVRARFGAAHPTSRPS